MTAQRFSKQAILGVVETLMEGISSNGTLIDSKEFAKNVYNQSKRCVICSKPSTAFGIFVPNDNADPVLTATKKSHQARYFFYGVCVAHWEERDGVTDEIEAILMEGQKEEEKQRQLVYERAKQSNMEVSEETMPDGTRWIAVGHFEDKERK